MENASKALIMAGAVLIAIIIISISLFSFKNFSRTAIKMSDMTEEEIRAFNSKIKPYLGIQSGTQVNVLIQYVISNNISVAQTRDIDKAITIEFPVDYNDPSKINRITVKKNTSSNKYELYYQHPDKIKRVETGSMKFYEVTAPYGKSGLITNITVKKKE